MLQEFSFSFEQPFLLLKFLMWICSLNEAHEKVWNWGSKRAIFHQIFFRGLNSLEPFIHIQQSLLFHGILCMKSCSFYPLLWKIYGHMKPLQIFQKSIICSLSGIKIMNFYERFFHSIYLHNTKLEPCMRRWLCGDKWLSMARRMLCKFSLEFFHFSCVNSI